MKKNTTNLFWNNQKKSNRRLILFEPIKVRQVSNSNLVPRMIKPMSNPFYIKSSSVRVPIKKVVKVKVVNDNTRVPKKEMNWIQAKSKFKNLNPFGDADKDGLMNYLDCKPFNPKRKDANPDPEGFYDEYATFQEEKKLKALDKKNRRIYQLQKEQQAKISQKEFDRLAGIKARNERKPSKIERGRIPMRTRDGVISVSEEDVIGPIEDVTGRIKPGEIKRFLGKEFPKYYPTKIPKKVPSGKVVIPEKIGTTRREKKKLESLRYVQKAKEEELAWKARQQKWRVPFKQEEPSPYETFKDDEKFKEFLKWKKSQEEQPIQSMPPITKTSAVSKTENKFFVAIKSPAKVGEKFELIAPGQTWRFETKGEAEKKKEEYLKKRSRQDRISYPTKVAETKTVPPIMPSIVKKTTQDLTPSLEEGYPISIKAPSKRGDKFEVSAPGQTWKVNTRLQAEKKKKEYIRKMKRWDNARLRTPKPAPKIEPVEKITKVVPKEVSSAPLTEAKIPKGRLSYSLTEGLIGLNVSRIARETGIDPVVVSNVLRKEISIEEISKGLRERTATEAKALVEQKTKDVLEYFKRRGIEEAPPKTIKEIDERLRNIQSLKGFARISTSSPYLGTERETELSLISQKAIPLIVKKYEIEKEMREKKDAARLASRLKKEEEKRIKQEKKERKKLGPVLTPAQKEFMMELEKDPWEIFTKEDYINPFKQEKIDEEKMEIEEIKEPKEEKMEIEEIKEPKEEKMEVEKTPKETPFAEELVEKVSKEVDEGKSAQELIEEVSNEKE